MKNFIKKSIFLLSLGLLSSGANAAYNCTTTFGGLVANTHTANLGVIDPLSATPIDFALPYTVTCSRTAGDSRRAETLAVSFQFAAGNSGNTANRRFPTPVANSNRYNIFTTAAYTTPWATFTPGSMTWTGSVAVPNTGPSTVNAVLYIRVLPSSLNDLGTFLDSMALTIRGGTRFTLNRTFRVQATFNKSCEFTTATHVMNFGTFTPSATPGPNVTQTTPLSVRCTKATPYLVGITAGSSGSEALRSMTGPDVDVFPYELARDAIFTLPIQSTGTNRFTGTGNGAVQNFTVHGRVSPPTAFIAPGLYSDSPSMIIEY